MRQRVVFGLLFWRFALRNQSVQPLIAAVRQTSRRFRYLGLALLEESKILLLALAKGGRKYLTCPLISD